MRRLALNSPLDKRHRRPAKRDAKDMSGNLFSLFEERARSAPRSAFLTSPRGAPWSEVDYSYADLLERSGAFANLFAQTGVRPGDRIAAQTDKSPDALFAYLGALRVGAAYLPLNPGYTDEETAYALSDASPALFLCRPEASGRLSPIAAASGVKTTLSLGVAGDGEAQTLARDCDAAFKTISRAPDDLAAILYTSGTTGRPKGAMLSHENLRSNCEALRDIWRFSEDDALIHALPIFHVHGLFVATNVCLAAGARMRFLPRFDAEEILRLMPEATSLMGVPTFYSRLLARPDLTLERAASMRVFISGSAPLSPETHDRFKARTGHAILERYGMTETGMIASNPYDGDRKPGAVGFPLPGVEVRVTNEAGRPAAEGETGGIEVRGPNVFKGYWNRPEAAETEFSDDGYFRTGDLGHFDASGYLFIDGREKDLIISGGLNVYPAEVEAALDRLPSVAESAVIGAPHADLGEAVLAVIAPETGAAPDAKEVIKSLRANLAGYKVPKKIVVIDALPRNAMGKIQKSVLRQTYEDAFGPRSAE